MNISVMEKRSQMILYKILYPRKPIGQYHSFSLLSWELKELFRSSRLDGPADILTNGKLYYSLDGISVLEYNAMSNKYFILENKRFTNDII